MSRRIPLWATLVPLVAGLGVWGVLWKGHANGLKEDLEQVAPEGSAIVVSGFPYRIEAALPNATGNYQGEALSAKLNAENLVVNRVPWQRDRQVITLQKPQAALNFSGLAGANLQLAADNALASLKLQDDRLARFSGVWHKAHIETGLFQTKVSADEFETHLREIYGKEAAPDGQEGPQAQFVLSGKNLRIGEGDGLGFALDSKFFASQPLRTVAAWVAGGDLVIEKATLSDAKGEIASLSGKIFPDAQGRLKIEAIVETICPANVRALASGTPFVSEKRTRKAEKVAISGYWPDGIMADIRDPSRPPAPVRGQEPDCPRLR